VHHRPTSTQKHEQLQFEAKSYFALTILKTYSAKVELAGCKPWVTLHSGNLLDVCFNLFGVHGRNDENFLSS
jgi:hypothetical protein